MLLHFTCDLYLDISTYKLKSVKGFLNGVSSDVLVVKDYVSKRLPSLSRTVREKLVN